MLLKLESVEAFYGGNKALKGVSLEVAEGEIVCLIGANGAGKSTLLNCISGIHTARRGDIFFAGKNVSRATPEELVSMGVVQVPENRQLFGPLSVEENLEMGAYLRSRHMSFKELKREIDAVLERFPSIASRRKQRAGTLSGGEQQMVAIARGLMADPKLLLLDEPSLGLAPLVVREIFHIIRQLQEDGRTILLVEQNALAALAVSCRAYVLETGRVTLSGPAGTLTQDPRIRKAFLGEDVA